MQEVSSKSVYIDSFCLDRFVFYGLFSRHNTDVAMPRDHNQTCFSRRLNPSVMNVNTSVFKETSSALARVDSRA